MTQPATMVFIRADLQQSVPKKHGRIHALLFMNRVIAMLVPETILWRPGSTLALASAPSIHWSLKPFCVSHVCVSVCVYVCAFDRGCSQPSWYISRTA